MRIGGSARLDRGGRRLEIREIVIVLNNVQDVV
jgi:hypothetical protein